MARLSREEALERIDRWLIGTAAATRLDGTDVPIRFANAWRVTADVAGEPTHLIVGVDATYPISMPTVMVVPAPPFPSFPHVEQDGHICTTNPSDRFDLTQVVEIVRYQLERAIDILDQGKADANAQDFRDEFKNYWTPLTEGRPVLSLLDPCGPSRIVRVRRGASHIIAGEDDGFIRRWLRNRGKISVSTSTLSDALLLWLPQPMLPSEYPCTGADLQRLAAVAGDPAPARLKQLLRRSQGDALVIIGADSSNGPALAATEVQRHRHFTGPRKSKRLKNRGLKPEALLADALRSRVGKLRVIRADPWWVHGRDSNDDLTTLRSARVALVGCGSLGSPVARLLAAAGIGELMLIDPELLGWENIGRHSLGAGEVSLPKAMSLANRLRQDYPHSQFTAHDKKWQIARDALPGCDLVISTIGSFEDEAELDRWQNERGFPAVLYGWMEPRACAAHAVLIGNDSGCFACGFTAAGDPLLQITSWPEPQVRREPACGGWFMPYGADEVASAAVLVTDLAIDFLMGRAEVGTHRMMAVRSALLELAGGAWSDAWVADADGADPGGRTRAGEWLARPSCPLCAGKGIE